jgi:hypothetical protein
MNRYFCWVLLITFCMAMVSGCFSRGDFTAISGKNVNLSSLKVDRTMAKGRTSGEDCQHTVIIFPTSGPSTLDEALDRALEPKQANLLLDAVVKWHNFYIPYIYGQNCWKVEGVAYDTFK